MQNPQPTKQKAVIRYLALGKMTAELLAESKAIRNDKERKEAEQEIRILRNGYVPTRLQSRFTEFIIRESVNSLPELNSIIEQSGDTWFYLHPEKIIGRQYPGTSFSFPIITRALNDSTSKDRWVQEQLEWAIEGLKNKSEPVQRKSEPVQKESEPVQSKDASGRFSNVQDIPREKIIVDPSRFQGRQGEFAEATVNAIVSKGHYDRSAEPIVVWYDAAKDKYVVISGHSRYEATRQLFESGKQPDLKTVPVKVFLGDEDDAIDYATLESNRGSTEEGLISDLAAYRRAKENGYNRKRLLTIFKPESKLKKLQDLASLNPKGRFVEALADEANRSYPYIERNARWVGVLRDNLPQLTDAHENEIFRFFYSSKKGLNITKSQFHDLINKRVNRIDFDPANALNLEDRVSSSALTDPITEQILEIEKDIQKLQKQINDKRQTIIRARTENKADMIPGFEKNIADLEKLIIRKLEEKASLQQQKGKVERTTTTDLFSSPPKPKTNLNLLKLKAKALKLKLELLEL